VQVVNVEGELRHLPLEQLQEAVSAHLLGGIVTQDLNVLKAAVEDLAWVDTASVRRVWPDRLVLSVREHEPLARWGTDGLVTAAGIVFRPERGELPTSMTSLVGRDEQAPEVVNRYLEWRSRFQALGLGITRVELDARGAWALDTTAEFTLALGTDQVQERVDRFLTAYSAVAAVGRPATVDMRYSNGLAVSWRDGDDGQHARPQSKARPGQSLTRERDSKPDLADAAAPHRGTIPTSNLTRPSVTGPRPSRS
jgi:cell division protein FtsQ